MLIAQDVHDPFDSHPCLASRDSIKLIEAVFENMVSLLIELPQARKYLGLFFEESFAIFSCLIMK